METQLLHLTQQNTRLRNAAVYVDYENIFQLLQNYGVNPLTINFFPVILDRLKEVCRLNILECIVYCNFDKKAFQGNQTVLQRLGLETRHAASIGKNCGDLMLTVDTLTALHKNPNIDVFIIISSDRDIIPLLKAIKFENKLTYVISTQYGFNPIVSCFADYHEYIEDIFNLTAEARALLTEKGQDLEILINTDNLNGADLENAREVSKLFYNSNVWKKYEEEGNPITLKGYVKIISPKIGGEVERVIRYFELAHYYKYITIYKDQNKGLCIKKGDNYLEILGLTNI